MARILIAEDDEDLLERVITWLEHEEHTITAVSDGQEALTELGSSGFDLLILDWDMPQVPGLEVCKQFRAAGGTAPVLMMTGKKEIDDKSQGFEAGADDYLTKPFHLKELSLRIKALLKRAPAKEDATPPADVSYKVCRHCGASYPLEREHCQSDGTLLETERVDPLLGTSFGDRYEILNVLGSGGMSVVYKARHKLMDRLVAIKVLSPELARQELAARRFQQEAKAVAKLKHPNIVSVHDFGVTEGANRQPFMVMDFIEGQSLEDILDEYGQLPVDRSLELFLKACDGLAHAHEHGIIHRDVKPANFMIESKESGNDDLKLVDFGIAKVMADSAQSQAKLTLGALSVGTCEYMSPEHCRGKELDCRSDVYSFGCVMFETLTGLLPFAGDNYLDTLQMQISQLPPYLAEIRPDLSIPKELEAIIMKALEKDPACRHQSMSELHHELVQIKALLSQGLEPS